VNWVHGQPPSEVADLKVQVRYRAPAVSANIELLSDSTMVTTGEPLNNVAPGQAAVFYEGDECLGGGIISR